MGRAHCKFVLCGNSGQCDGAADALSYRLHGTYDLALTAFSLTLSGVSAWCAGARLLDLAPDYLPP